MRKTSLQQQTCIEHPTDWCPLGTSGKDKIHVETISAVEEEKTSAAQ